MLAMGFANEPALLIADEPTTALDVTIQAQILDLLRALNADLGTAVILISHDLGVIAKICSRVLVMYAGEVVEEGRPEELLSDPRHPYTWALLHAAPRLDANESGDRRLITIEGQPPDPRALAGGLPVSRALPVRDREMRRASGAARGRAGTAGAVLGDAGAADGSLRRRGASPPCRGAGARETRAERVLRGARVWPSISRCRAAACSEKRRVLRAVDGVDLDVVARRDGRARRRVRLRQIDAGAAGDAAARADRRAASCSTASDITHASQARSVRCGGACR